MSCANSPGGMKPWLKVAGQRRQPAIWPFSHVELRNDHPARWVIKAQGLLDTNHEFDGLLVTCRRSAGDRQQDDITQRDRRIGGGNQRRRTGLSLVATASDIFPPGMVTADTKAGFGSNTAVRLLR